MFEDHYIDWRKSRQNCILKYINNDFFFNKKLLELGCGFGHNGYFFSKLGCDVTCSDARIEHLTKGGELYKELKFEYLNCNNNYIIKNYDIILHWGLLYHLNIHNIENHIKNVCDKCDYLFLETEVCDSDDIHVKILNEYDGYNGGYDQSVNGEAIRPSPKYVENILNLNNFNFLLIKDTIINSSFHIYDWDIKNTKEYRHGLRRFWICWKKGCNSPIKNII